MADLFWLTEAQVEWLALDQPTCSMRPAAEMKKRK